MKIHMEQQMEVVLSNLIKKLRCCALSKMWLIKMKYNISFILIFLLNLGILIFSNYYVIRAYIFIEMFDLNYLINGTIRYFFWLIDIMKNLMRC